jgi:hypothetical protein
MRSDSEAVKSEVTSSPPELLQRGIDWVTAVCGNDWDHQAFYDVAFEAAAGYQEDGNDWDAWRFSGYEGFRCGPIAYGRREDGAIVRASSVAAGPAFERLHQIPGVRPSRVDLQTTIDYKHDPVGWARELAQKSLEARQAGLKHKGWQIHVRDGFGTGDALEIGSRASEAYGRVYDKHREAVARQREQNKGVGVGAYPLGSWRYEVEYKGSQARQVWDYLASAPDVEVASSGLVCSWYGARGVDVPVKADNVPVLRSVHITSDVARQLAWLGGSVSPTVLKLLKAGYRQQVLDVLGL